MEEMKKIFLEELKAKGGEICDAKLRSTYISYLVGLVKDANAKDDILEHMAALYDRLVRWELTGHRQTTKPEIVEKLLNVVDELEKTSFEGSLASVFILHQIAEEWVFELLSVMRFAVDLKLSWLRVDHKNVEKMNFSGIYEEIERSFDFTTKEALMNSSREMNRIRNRIAHELLKIDSLESIQRDVRRYLEAFQKFDETLDEAMEEMRDLVKQFWKWSDGFQEDLVDHLRERLEDHGITFMNEDEFEEASGLKL